MKKLLLLFILIISATTVSARKFSFKNEKFAGFFRMTGGPSLLGADAFSKSSGSSTVFMDKVEYNFSGEIGFLLFLHEKMSLKFGFEAVQSRDLTAIVGKNSSGTKYMDLTSRSLALIPEATLEFTFSNDATSRWFGFFGAGTAAMTLDNAYIFTAAGSAAYAGIADYTEKSQESVFTNHYGVGYETLFVDNVTAVFELGYRNLAANSLTYRHNHTGAETTLQGDKTKGSDVVNDDSTSRKLNLSGFYLGLAFRFYIPTL